MRLRKLAAAAALALLFAAPASAVLPCSTIKIVQSSGGDATTISGAIALLPSNIVGGNACVNIHDSRTYAEQVSISGFTTNGNLIVVQPGSGNFPVVTPPAGSTAAFVVANASVAIAGIQILAAGAITYGIQVSSPNVTLSSVSIVDSAGYIGAKGVQLSTDDAITYSTVAVTSVEAVNIPLNGARNFLSNSSFTVSGASVRAVDILGSSNTVSQCVMISSAGFAMQIGGGGYNTVAQSTMSTTTGFAAASITNGSPYNTISYSSMTATGSGSAALWVLSSSNTVVQSAMSSGYQDLLFDNATTSNTADGCVGVGGGASASLVDILGNGNAIKRSVFTDFGTQPVIRINGGQFNTISQSTGISSNGGTALLLIGNASTNTAVGSYFQTSFNSAVGLGGGNGNSVSGSTVVTIGYGGPAFTVGGSSNSIVQSVIDAAPGGGGGIQIFSGGAGNVIYQTTATASNSAWPALYFNTASSETVTQSYFYNATGYSVYFDGNAAYNNISLSTMVSAGAKDTIDFFLASSNTVTLSSITSRGGSTSAVRMDSGPGNLVSSSTIRSITDAVFFNSGSYGNAVSSDIIHTESNAAAIDMWGQYDTVSLSSVSTIGGTAVNSNGSFGESVVQSFVYTSGAFGIGVNNSPNFQIQSSTIIASGFASTAVQFSGCSNCSLSGSYAQGSSALAVRGSTGTIVDADRLDATSAGSAGTALQMTLGSAGLSLTRSVLNGTSVVNSTGIYVDAGSSGTIVIATNTFLFGAPFQLDVEATVPGAAVFIASNTIAPNNQFPGTTYGIYLNGLASGATVSNNSIFVPGGAVGSSSNRFGVFAKNFPGLVLDHNRVNFPTGGVGTSDSETGLSLVNAPNAVIKFNDLAIGAGNAASATNLSLANGSFGASLRDNIMVNASNSLSTRTIVVDATSVPGFRSNFNDFYSGPTYGPTGLCNGISVAMNSSWPCGGNQDAYSLASDPQWFGTAAGAEDFHPRSPTGRWVSAIGTFTFVDISSSPTIDAGDPAEPYSAEINSGYRANLGSYGGTSEASQSPPGPCAVNRFVCKNGTCPNRSIQEAAVAIPNPLPGYTCVLVEDSATYPDPVLVSGFALAGSSVAIELDPSLPSFAAHPVIVPAIAAAGLTIQSSGVTVSRIDFGASAANTGFAIKASSSGVMISSVAINDPTGLISTAAVSIVGGDSIVLSTIQVFAANGIEATGAAPLISMDSVTVGGPAAANGHYGIYLNSVTGGTITLTGVSMPVTGRALEMDGGSNFVSFSSFSAASSNLATVNSTGLLSSTFTRSYVYDGANYTGMYLAGNVTVDQSTVVSAGGSGTGIWSVGGYMSITASSVTAGIVGVHIQNASGGQIVNSAFAARDPLEMSGDSGYLISNSFFQSPISGPAVILYNGTSLVSISASTMTNASTEGALKILGTGVSNTISNSYMFNPSGPAAALFNSSTVTIQASTLVASGPMPTVYSVNSQTCLLSNDSIVAISSNAASFDALSSFITVSGSTLTAPGSLSNSAALQFFGAHDNQVVGSVISGGVDFESAATRNQILSSTVTNAGVVFPALYFYSASANTVSNSYVSAPNFGAAQFGAPAGGVSTQNLIAQSTLVGGGASSYAASFLAGSSTNTLLSDAIANMSGTAVFFQQTTSNTVVGSTLTGNGSATAFFGVGASTNSIVSSSITNITAGSGYPAVSAVAGSTYPLLSQDFLSSSGNTVVLIGAGAVIARSTITTVNPNASALFLNGAGGSTIVNSYLQGSSAAFVTGASSTSFAGDYLTATGNGNSGLAFVGGAAGLSVSSCVVAGPANGAGILVAASAGLGAISLTTNTILSGPQYGVSVSAGGPIYLSSNTVLATITSSTNTYGLYFNGVPSGTVARNSVYYRGSGSMGAQIAYGVYALSSTLQFDHNRIDDPGAITGGGFVGMKLVQSPSNVKFNDFAAVGNGLSLARVLELTNSAGATVKDNAFLNEMINTSPNYSVAINVDAPSQVGLQTDYNDYFVNGPLAYIDNWGAFPGSHSGTLAGYRTAAGGAQELHSTFGDPLWASIAAGSEDFHLKSSQVNGRYNPASQSFSVTDSSSSAAIDSADPSEPYGNELLPNGLRANGGSYGNTPEASKSAPPPGCDEQRTVAQSGVNADATSIAAGGAGSALGQFIAAHGSTLNDNWCIVVVTTVPIFEEVDIAGLNANGHRLTIMGHPNLTGGRATIDPNGGTNAGFLIQNDSVTIFNIDVNSSGSIPYGIAATSQAAIVSSVNVIGSNYTNASVLISTGASVAYTTAAANGAPALKMIGAGGSVFASSFTNVSASSAAAALLGATGATISQSYFFSFNNNALTVLSGSNGNAIFQSTAVSYGAGASALMIDRSSFNTVSQLFAQSNSGGAVLIGAQTYANAVWNSTMTSGSSGNAAYQAGGSSNSVVGSVMTNQNGTAVSLQSAIFETIAQSSGTSATGAQATISLSGSTSTALFQDYFYNSAGSAASLAGNSVSNVSSMTTFWTDGIGAIAVLMGSVSQNTFFSCTMEATAGTGLQMNPSTNNAFTGDSMYGGGGNGYGVLINGGSNNTFSACTMTGPNGWAASLQAGTVGNTISNSNLSSQLSGKSAAQFLASNSNTIYASVLNGGAGDGVDMSGASNQIVFSTAIGYYGVGVTSATAAFLTNDYIQGSTAVVVLGSTGTTVASSVLYSTSPLGFALETTGGAAGILVTSNTMTGGTNRAVVYIDAGGSGTTILSTNVFVAGSPYSMFVATPAANAALWITSNTFVMAPSASNPSGGVFLDGLSNGATVQNNGFYVRTSGSMGSSTMFALLAQSTNKVVVDHNRFSNPAMVTAGSYAGVLLNGAQSTTLKFNDFLVATLTGSPLTNAFGIQMLSSPGTKIFDNAFLSSMTVTGSSATISGDGGSVAGFAADYNSFFSSTTRNSMVYSGVAYQYPWSALGFDVHSSSYHPRWFSTAPNAEDFHPLSQAGRWNIGATTLTMDAWTAATIDAADPAEPHAAEQGANDRFANGGSYGGTNEASESPAAPGAPFVAAVYGSSVAVSFAAAAGPGTPQGYRVIASTASDFSAPVFSSATPGFQSQLAPQGLAFNTTYYFAAQALWGDMVLPNAAAVSTITLPSAPTTNPGGSFTGVAVAAASALWLPNGNPVSSTTYTLVFSTNPTYQVANLGNVTITTTPAGSPAEGSTSSLVPNTTYFAFVAAVSASGQSSPFVLLGSTSTLPSQPNINIPFATGLSSTTLGVSWGTNGNPLTVTTYTVVLSTDPYPNSDAGNVTLSTAPAGGPSATVSGLAPDATYYFEVAAVGFNGQQTAFNFSGNPSTMTGASPPTAGPFVVSSSVSITASWGANGNPAGALYDLVSSSDPAFSVAVASSFTYSLSASTAGLSPNTTYYFKVQALNGRGIPTAFVALASTASWASPPASAASTWTAVNPSSAAVAWSANGNPPGTTYTVQLSTASDFNAFASSFTVSTAPSGAPGAVVNGLTFFTTYYLRVAAVNWNGVSSSFVALGSTTTLPPSLFPPAPSGVPVVATTAISASWTVVGAATGYLLVASTQSVTPPVLVAASSAPAGTNATSAQLGGLSPDTTYFLFVQALGVNAVSSFTAFAATSTLPAPPATVASTFSSVAFTSFTVSWSANGNPIGYATYTVVASTASDFNAFASSVSFSTVPAGAPTATFSGLFANATYYFEVMTVGNFGAVAPFTTLGSTTTSPAPPTAAAPTFVSVSSSAASVAWSRNSNQPTTTRYLLVLSTASDFNAFASSAAVSTTPFGAAPQGTATGLSPNTTYYAGALAFGVNGSSSPLTSLGSTSTLAALPSTGAFVVSANAIVANWTGGGNPAGTLYALVASSDPAFSAAVSSTFTYALTYSSGALVPNTSYYFKIQAVNNGGIPTGFVQFGATTTLANQPLTAATTFTAVNQTSVTVNWSSNGNPVGVTNYLLQASTDPAFSVGASSVSFATAPVAGPTATMGGLAFGTTYYFRVAAVNNGGVATAFTNLGSTATLLSNLIPQIVNAQAGDTTWRATNVAGYAVRFVDGSGTHLDKFQVSASTVPGGAGPNLIGFTDVRNSLSPADSFSSTWTLPTAVFNALVEGVTNYITVRVYNNVPATSTVVDAFFVLKDTTPPSITNPLAGGDATVRSSSGTAYAVSAADAASGLSAFQYSVSLNKGSGDASLIPWTNVAALPPGVTFYATPWTVNFAGLSNGTSNFVSVRAIDAAGLTTQATDAFAILKDTIGPTVAISTPSAATGFVSAAGTISGTSFSSFTIQGTEVSVYQPVGNVYWDPVTMSFASGSPKWMPATGTTTWTLSPGVAFADGVGYRVIARSSTTFGEYSTRYATASFVFDASTPTVGVLAPVPNSTVSSLPIISGTATDPSAGAASGVSSVEVRLMRRSDGFWWNWFAQNWSAVAVSTIAVGTTTWSVTPSALLQANLLSGASYFVAVRASDSALPANQGNFFVPGATFTYSNPTPPSAPASLTAVSGPTSGQVRLSWVSPGENGNSGIVLNGHYAVYYATYGAAVPSTAAAQVLLSTAGVAPGTTVGYTVAGLTPSVTYFLEIALQNTDGNWSPFSNQASTNATPAPLNAINGHVVDASTNGITGVEVDAYDTTGALVSTTFTLADGSGTYSVGGLSPGTYKLQASWTVNGVTSSVWQDGIPMGSINVDFSLQINYALATLTGTLATLTTSAARTGSSPAALARPQGGGSFVEVYQRNRAITRVGVQPSGRWTVPSLLPGAYAVRAFTGVSYTDFQNVTLSEGETRNIGFVFDPLPDASVFAFPNPAKNSTTFRFVTPFAAGFQASIDIFDAAGRLVREIPGSAVVPQPTTGLYHADWDLTNTHGQAVASGVYIFVLKVKGDGDQLVKVVKKLAVVR